MAPKPAPGPPRASMTPHPTGEAAMSVIDELLANAEQYARTFDKGALPLPPAKHVAVVACMDARLNVYGLLGLAEGDAHIIRNAGGAVTEDEIRSLTISQRLLGTREIILIHHTDCGMLTFTDDEFKAQIATETGIRLPWATEAFSDPRPTCDSPSPGSRPARSSRTPTRYADSCTRWRMERSPRSAEARTGKATRPTTRSRPAERPSPTPTPSPWPATLSASSGNPRHSCRHCADSRSLLGVDRARQRAAAGGSLQGTSGGWERA